jgi:hypothetical protein
MKQQLGKLERVPLREAWRHEANDFTPWLAEESNLAVLADALDLSDLALVATEHRVGEFKLDILCISGDEQVIIENQLEKTDHTHLGQLLTYAAGTGARKVIWVAESFRPEHVAALDFLNQNTTDDLNFFAVEVELWRIGDSALAPKFEVVAKPNAWARIGREQARAAAQSTPARQRQLELWQALVEAVAVRAPELRPQRPRPQHWLNLSVGRSGFALAATASLRDDRLGVELYISHVDSKAMFQALLAQKPALEQQLGFELDWQELPDAHACRIATWRPDSPIEDEAQWGAYLDWFAQRLVRMNAVFRPAIRELS